MVLLTIKSVKDGVNTTSGEIRYIDYFSIRRLDIILAIIFIYIMVVFTTISIIFSHNSVQLSSQTGSKCDPLLYYLGNQSGCTSIKKETMENQYDETTMEKIIYIYRMVTYPLLKLYQTIVYILSHSALFSRYVRDEFSKNVFYYLDKQNEFITNITNAFIGPIYMKMNDRFVKGMQTVVDKYK